MVEILVSGHNQFATGLLSSMKLIAGEQATVKGVDFLEGYSTDELKSRLLEKIDGMGTEILILADLAGGSPYNVSVLLQSELKDKNVEVVSGANLPMLLSCVFAAGIETAAEMADNAVTEARDGVVRFQLKKPSKPLDDFDDDGI